MMKKNMVIKTGALLILAMSLIFLSGQGQNSLNQKKKQAFRLHVVANSDENIDQEIKYAVRDAVLACTKNDLAFMQSKQEAKEYIDANLKRIEIEAKKVLTKYDADYSLMLKTGVLPFPDKYYGNIFYPKGKYDALKIMLGDGAGQNWWCVMFPPLCVIGVEKNEENTEQKKREETQAVEYKSFIAEKIKDMKKDDKNDDKIY